MLDRVLNTPLDVTPTNPIASQQFMAQPAFTCSKLIIETVEQGVKYVQS